MKYSFAIACLLANTSAIQLSDPSVVHGTYYGDKNKIFNFNDQPVLPLATHENEDYHSGPDPLSGNKYLTSTQVKYLRNDQTDLASEVQPFNSLYFRPYNAGSPEPTGKGYYVQLGALDSDEYSSYSDNEYEQYSEESGSEYESDSESDSEEEPMHVQRKQQLEAPEETVVLQILNNKKIMWHVSADLGEHDPGVVYRENDVSNGKKVSGWTNPLGWADGGDDDDKILAQMKYAESEGPTKADNGEADDQVVLREHDTANGSKFHGWTNPLGWTDGGDADESVL